MEGEDRGDKEMSINLKEMSVNLKENVNKTVIRQTMQWGSDCRAVGKLIKMNKTLSVNDMLGGERVRIKGKISVERNRDENVAMDDGNKED